MNKEFDNNTDILIEKNENIETVETVETVENSENTDTKPVKILKKRGRKPSGKILDIKNFDQKHISSLDPEKECLIIHLPITTKDINKITNLNTNLNSNKLEMINEIDMETNNNIFIDIDKNELNKKMYEISQQSLHNKELLLSSELQLTETSDNKKKCYNCQYLNERCNALHQKLQEVSNVKNIQESMISKIHECTIDIVDSETCKWKKTTNLSCWWCVHTFTNPPFGLPIKVVNNKYYVQGCFCSLNCAKAYNIKENNYRTTEINSLIEDFRRELFGMNSYPVMLAPPRQALSMFGGYLSIEEFRKEFYIMNKNIIHLSPTVAPVRNIFEEEYHDKLIRANSSGLRPRLKRNTTPPQMSYNLDKIMSRTEEEP